MSLEAAIYNEARKAASGAPLWSSGMTVAQWQEVRSPLDGEVYRRKTATGSGATDPADDTTNYVAVSYSRVTALPAPGTTARTMGGAIGKFANGANKSALNSVPVATRTQILNMSGRGSLLFAAIVSNESTNYSRRLEVVIDGRTVLDVTVSFAGSGDYQLFVGTGTEFFDGTTLYPVYSAIPQIDLPFRRSCSVYLTTSAVEEFNNYFCYSFKGEA